MQTPAVSRLHDGITCGILKDISYQTEFLDALGEIGKRAFSISFSQNGAPLWFDTVLNPAKNGQKKSREACNYVRLAGAFVKPNSSYGFKRKITNIRRSNK